jgi:16S rRNA processing protein RimM
LLEVGRVGKPHGLKGEVIVHLFTDRVERIAAGSVLASSADGSSSLAVVRSSPHQGNWIVTFDGVVGREGAERLRGTVLYAEPIDDPDALWVHELVGASVVGVDGRPYGVVTAVEANPASDLLVLEGGGLVPLRFVTAHQPGQVTIDPPAGLLD